MKNKIRRLICWTPTVLLSVAIFCFSAQTATTSSAVSDSAALGLLDLIRLFVPGFDVADWDTLIHVIRKCAHFGIYLCLELAAFYAFFKERSAFGFASLCSLGYCLLYAVSDEIHQLFVPGRSCEARDVFIDFCGALLGFLLCTLVFSFREKRKSQRTAK